MNEVKLEFEHIQLKKDLEELVDFINSADYYKLNEHEKQLIATQRCGMEIYMNALSVRLWGNGDTWQGCQSSVLPLLASLLFMPSLNTPPFPIDKASESVSKEEKKD